MPLLLHFKTLSQVLVSHKIFTSTLLITLFLLLVRIPLGTFQYPSYLDTIAHFILPAVSAPLIAHWLIDVRFFPPLTAKSFLFIFVLIATTVEVVWEIFEYFIDLTFRWNWQLSNGDTMIDLILAVAGGIVGGYVFLKIYHNK